MDTLNDTFQVFPNELLDVKIAKQHEPLETIEGVVMIKIICVGKIKESFFIGEAVQEYLKRLSKYTRIEIQEVADDGSLEPQTQIHRESERVMKQIQAKDYVILMDIDGRELSSSDFARELDQTFLTNSNVTFVIGGSYGLMIPYEVVLMLEFHFPK